MLFLLGKFLGHFKCASNLIVFLCLSFVGHVLAFKLPGFVNFG